MTPCELWTSLGAGFLVAFVATLIVMNIKDREPR